VDGKQVSRKTGVRRCELGDTPKAQVRAATRLGCDIIEVWATESAKPVTPTAGQPLTLTQLASRYEADGFAGRTAGYKRDALAAIHRVAAYLGKQITVQDLKPSAVQKYMAHRIAKGRAPAGRGDFVALSIAINWAIGEELLEVNPLATKRARDAMRIHHEQSRPVADATRYAKLKAIADQMPDDFGVLLDVAWHTGHRISAILGLRWKDVSFAKTDDAPHGTIRWYAGAITDKKKHDHVLPMNAVVSAALEAWKKEAGVIGASPKWVFESPKEAKKPMERSVAKHWLWRAETLAKLDHEKGGGWHAFRRGWATSRKHLPLKDVAAGGGWTDTASVLECYQHSDKATTRAVALHTVG
jgi:integrase